MIAIRSFRGLAALAPFCLTAMLALAPVKQAEAFEIQKVTSPGGITAWLVEEHAIPLVAMRFSFAGGSSSDPADRPGVSYFLSGMLDEGAGDMTSEAFQDRISDLAVKLSFDADRDEFEGSLQTLSENRDAAFDMLRLAITSPRFDAAPLEKVRQQIEIGIRDDEQDPEAIAINAWLQKAYPNDPYGRSVKGTSQSVGSITADDLRAQMKKMFGRDTLVISVVGDIDAATLAPLLDKTFGSLPEKSGVAKMGDAPPVSGNTVSVIDRDIPQSVIQFGHAGFKRNDADYIPAYVMNFILGDGGFGSRLTEEVREKRGLTYGIYTSLYPLLRTGMFIGAYSTMNEKAGETLGIVRKEIERMANEGPTQAELDEAKTYITGSYALSFDNNRKIAGQLQSIQRQNLGIDYVNNRNKLIDAVTLDDVKRVAKRLLKTNEMIVTVVGRPKDVTPQ